MNDIKILSELRSNYNCFDIHEQPIYHALSVAIIALNNQSEKIQCNNCRYYNRAKIEQSFFNRLKRLRKRTTDE